jgi:hypothetical protein
MCNVPSNFREKMMKAAAYRWSQFILPVRVEEHGEEDNPADEFIDLDEFDLPWADDGDPRWDVFIPDDDERDPLPQPGDFWIDSGSDFAGRNAA